MRVLIVEDEAKMAGLIRRGLQREGMAVDVAGDGEEAVWKAEAVDYDAIVLDLMLPGIDGLEVCRRLRESGVWSSILMLTARDAVKDRVAGLDRGADDYLTKPFSYAELLARLRAVVRRGAPERPIEPDGARNACAAAGRRASRNVLLEPGTGPRPGRDAAPAPGPAGLASSPKLQPRFARIIDGDLSPYDFVPPPSAARWVAAAALRGEAGALPAMVETVRGKARARRELRRRRKLARTARRRRGHEGRWGGRRGAQVTGAPPI